MARRGWLLLVVAVLVSVALFVAGVVVWRMTATPLLVPPCPAHTTCSLEPTPGVSYRVHPLRAEMLWAASAVSASIAVGAGLWRWRRPTLTRPASA